MAGAAAPVRRQCYLCDEFKPQEHFPSRGARCRDCKTIASSLWKGCRRAGRQADYRRVAEEIELYKALFEEFRDFRVGIDGRALDFAGWMDTYLWNTGSSQLMANPPPLPSPPPPPPRVGANAASEPEDVVINFSIQVQMRIVRQRVS